jgi:hypothetical protein
MKFRSGMRFLLATGGDPPPSTCREVADPALSAAQSAIGLGHGGRIALGRPPGVHTRAYSR